MGKHNSKLHLVTTSKATARKISIYY